LLRSNHGPSGNGRMVRGRDAGTRRGRRTRYGVLSPLHIDRCPRIGCIVMARWRDAADVAINEAALRRAILTLWQTNLLRISRLRVIDEVANGLSYYDYTFLSELPRLYADLEEELAIEGVTLDGALPSFFRVGSWIGSDRDGNPFVTEEVLRAALRAQSGRA